ncbi:hypothetical protein HUJ05_005952 [Dendroctonus ponderosae]|nr:hypothetical protein HUJ05_005952 [Dendroctonus ponderosae]
MSCAYFPAPTTWGAEERMPATTLIVTALQGEQRWQRSIRHFLKWLFVRICNETESNLEEGRHSFAAVEESRAGKRPSKIPHPGVGFRIEMTPLIMDFPDLRQPARPACPPHSKLMLSIPQEHQSQTTGPIWSLSPQPYRTVLQNVCDLRSIFRLSQGLSLLTCHGSLCFCSSFFSITPAANCQEFPFAVRNLSLMKLRRLQLQMAINFLGLHAGLRTIGF